MFQSKDKDWLNGLKKQTNETPIDSVYKRPTSNLGTHRAWKWGAGMRYHVNGDQKKVGLATLISDKIDFKIKTIIRDKKDTT